MPPGWLECNGQSTSGYSALAALIGAYVPDLRGEFIRGLDNGRGVDSGRGILTAQEDAFEAHSHSIALGNGGDLGGFANASYNSGHTTYNTDNAGNSTETRPRNVALMYIIKT